MKDLFVASDRFDFLPFDSIHINDRLGLISQQVSPVPGSCSYKGILTYVRLKLFPHKWPQTMPIPDIRILPVPRDGKNRSSHLHQEHREAVSASQRRQGGEWSSFFGNSRSLVGKTATAGCISKTL